MERKVIIIDLLCSQPFGFSKFHGAGEYTKAVFKRITEIYNSERVLLCVCYNKDLFLDDWLLRLISSLNSVEVYDVKSYGEIVDIVNKKSLTGQVVFYAGLANQYPNATFNKSVMTIGTCHGLRQIEKQFDRTYLYYSKSFKDILRFLRDFVLYRSNKKKIYNAHLRFLNNFQTIITVSNHSRNSLLLNFYSILKSKNLYTCYTPSKVSEIETVKRDGNYIMMISANRWIKNGYRGIKAIDHLYDKGMLEGVDTVIYGGVSEFIKRRIKNINRFKFYGYASNEELEKAYSCCGIFFYPTLNEGFGMPPIEAQKYGKTCVISAVSSLPEIYGDSVYYCNPYDDMEMQCRLLEAFNERLPEDKILKHVKMLNKKQDDDLTKLANIILGN